MPTQRPYAHFSDGLRVSTRPLGSWPLIVAFATLGLASPARASTPTGIIVRPSAVKVDTTTANPRVVIEGVFALIADPKTASYTFPLVGTMYFECPAGQASLCQLEWKDITTAATNKALPLLCSMFGAVDQKMGTVRPVGAPLGTPDPYPIAQGVLNTPSALGICPQLVAPPTPDAGVKPDSSAPDAGVVADAAAPTPDASAGADLGAGVDAAKPAADLAAGADASATSPTDRGGCAVAPSGARRGSEGALALVLLLGLGLGLVTRRRPSRRR